MDRAIKGFEDYTKNSRERLITAADNSSFNRTNGRKHEEKEILKTKMRRKLNGYFQ